MRKASGSQVLENRSYVVFLVFRIQVSPRNPGSALKKPPLRFCFVYGNFPAVSFFNVNFNLE